jgi:hypothetical protein
MRAGFGCDPDDEITYVANLRSHMITRRTRFKEEVVNEVI